MDLKTLPLHYDQTVADEATFAIVRRCEVIVVGNARKYSVDSPYACRLKKLDRLSSTTCGLFSSFSQKDSMTYEVMSVLRTSRCTGILIERKIVRNLSM